MTDFQHPDDSTAASPLRCSLESSEGSSSSDRADAETAPDHDPPYSSGPESGTHLRRACSRSHRSASASHPRPPARTPGHQTPYPPPAPNKRLPSSSSLSSFLGREPPRAYRLILATTPAGVKDT